MNAFVARLAEGSSWAAIAAALVALGVNLDPGLWKSVTLAGTGVAALLGYIIPESKA